MPNPPKIDQLDPFNEHKGEFQAKEIRHSRSRETRKLLNNLESPEDNKNKSRLWLIIGIITALIFGVLVIIFIPKLLSGDEQKQGQSITNPVGRETSTDYTNDPDSPELRAVEQEKLDALNELIDEKDWRYANATFKTIYPDYLDDCGKYSYYRAALTLAEKFEYFTLDAEMLTSRAEVYAEKCRS